MPQKLSADFLWISRQDLSHPRDALLRGKLRVRPAHICLHPAGIKHHHTDPARLQLFARMDIAMFSAVLLLRYW